MKTSPQGRKFIEDFEGLFLEAYDDAMEKTVQVGHRAMGTLTIGYGHTTAAGPPRVRVGMVITSIDAGLILSADLAHVEADVNRIVKVPLSQEQFDALVSFHFNTGWLTHPRCSLLVALNSGNYDLAAKEFALYNRASGHLSRGLIRRREAEMKLFGEGIYG